MITTKTRTLIVALVASSSFAVASMAPAASQALPPIRGGANQSEGSQVKACEIHQGWYEFWRNETIRAIENFEYTEAFHYAENAAAEKAAAQSEGCLDADTWATVPSPPPVHRAPAPPSPPLSIA